MSTAMNRYVRQLSDLVSFQAGKGTKADLFRGERLFVGLNCFEPGQSQPPHVHPGADKFYYVVSGRARFTVADESCEAAAGAVVWAPADVPHGVEQALERTVMLVGIAPPPR
jgi:quercetin dioxygenase-like cupin family protein